MAAEHRVLPRFYHTVHSLGAYLHLLGHEHVVRPDDSALYRDIVANTLVATQTAQVSKLPSHPTPESMAEVRTTDS